MSMYHTKSITELSAMLQAGEVSSVELTRYFLDRIKNSDDKLNSFITVCEEQAMKEAEAADEKLMNMGADFNIGAQTPIEKE